MGPRKLDQGRGGAGSDRSENPGGEVYYAGRPCAHCSYPISGEWAILVNCQNVDGLQRVVMHDGVDPMEGSDLDLPELSVANSCYMSWYVAAVSRGCRDFVLQRIRLTTRPPN
jgi:hypothetical protein